MEIVAPGWKDPKWSRRIECLGCGATLKVGRSDLKVRYFHVNPPLYSIVYQCCACGEETELREYRCQANLSRDWGELPVVGRTGWRAGE